MALVYAQVDFELRDILLKNKPRSMLEYSPKGTVPVFITNNKVIDESLDIMLWSLKQKDVDGWLQPDNQLQLISLCETRFKAQLDRYKYHERFDLTQVQYFEKTWWFLQLLEERLQNNNYLFSNAMSLADCAIFPFIRQYAFVDRQMFDSLPFTCLKKWLERHLQSELFQSIMKKSQIWSEYD